MIEDLMKSSEEKMNQAIDSLAKELSKVRTGRAQISQLDTVKIPYYGNLTPLSQVAAVSTPDAKSFLISPWEGPMLKQIEQAIVKSNLGMTPQNDGKVIRLKVPELTEERRKDLVKAVKKMTEDSRVSIRMARRDANESLKKMEKSKDISEDQLKTQSEKIQKLTDQFIKKVDTLSENKEKELLVL